MARNVLVRDPGQRLGSGYFYDAFGYLYHLNQRRFDGRGGAKLYLRCVHHSSIQVCRGVVAADVTVDGAVIVGPPQRHTCRRDPLRHLELRLRREILEECRRQHFDLPHAVLTRLRSQYVLSLVHGFSTFLHH